MRHSTSNRLRAREGIVRTLRKQGRNVAWLSREVKLSRQYTSEILHGHVEIAPEIAERIADKLEVDIFFLFDVSGSTTSEPVEAIA